MKKTVVRYGLTLLCLMAPKYMQAHFPKELIIIGDSLSDSGNSRPQGYGDSIFNLTARYTPATDGTTWPVLLAEKLDAETLLPSVQGGTNFAYVAAFTKGSFVFFPNPSLTEQEQKLLPATTNRKHPVFVFGGSNDILFNTAEPQIGKEAAFNLSQILDNLHQKKYKTLIVINLPNIGLTPKAESSADVYTANSILFNTTLNQELKKKKYSVLAIDFFNVFSQLVANPKAFGLVNSKTAPIPDASIPFNGESTAGFVFWYDGTHPTQASHRLIADYVFSILTAAECSASLAELPFGLLREQRTNIHQQLAPVQKNHAQYVLYPFISGSYSPLLQPPFSDNCKGKDGQGDDVTVGLTDRVAEDWTIGIAGSHATASSKCHETKNQCHLHLKANVLSIFAGFSRDHGYLNGIYNIGWLKYKTHRKFLTGTFVNRPHGHSKGMDHDTELYGAYFIPPLTTSHFKTGPLAELNYQWVHVEGYKESGAAFGNLKYRDQENSIFSTGLGWEMLFNYPYPKWELIIDLFLTANRQWLEHKRHIRLREVSLPGTHGAWPVVSERNTYASGGLDLSALFEAGPNFTLGYAFNVGTKEMSEHFLTASFSFPLWKKKN